MTFSVDQLKGEISKRGGIANPTLYNVILPSRWGGWGANTRDMNLICTRVNLPGRQIATVDKVIGGKMEKVPYNNLFGDVTMTFMLLNDYGARNYFENWMDTIINQSNYEPAYKNEYASQIRVQQLDKDFGDKINTKLSVNDGFFTRGLSFSLDIKPNDVVYETRLIDAFPVTMTDIDLSNASNDQVAEFQVTFSYTKYRTKTNLMDYFNDKLEPLTSILDRL